MTRSFGSSGIRRRALPFSVAALLACALAAVPRAGASTGATDAAWGERGFVQANAGEALWAPLTLAPGAGGRLDALLTTRFLGGGWRLLAAGPDGRPSRAEPLHFAAGLRSGPPGAAVRLADGRFVTTANREETFVGSRGTGYLAGSGFGLAAFHADGQPDASFGSAGVALVPALDVAGQATGVAATPAGLLAAGRTARFGDLAVARFSLAGAADPSFGPAGVRTVRVPGYRALGPVFVIALGAGRIAVAGTVRRGSDGTQRIAVVRFSAAGVREGAVVLARLAAGARASAVCGAAASGGRLLLVGSLARSSGGLGCPQDVSGRLRVARLRADGAPDRTFNATGFESVSFGAPFAGAVPPSSTSDRAALPAFVRGDGRITVGGALADGGAFAITRLLADGRPDRSLGGSGRTCLAPPRTFELEVGAGALVLAAGPAGTTYAATARSVIGDDSIITLARLRASSRQALPCAAIRVGVGAKVSGLLTVPARLSVRVQRVNLRDQTVDPVGTVSLGTRPAGPFRLTWDLTVRGRPIHYGTYRFTILARPPGSRRADAGPPQDIEVL